MSSENYQDWSKKMEIPKILSVYPQKDKNLLVKFTNGVEKTYNCKKILQLDSFELLNNEAFFKAVKVDAGGYGVSWNDDLDLSEYELWTEGVKVEKSIHITDTIKEFVADTKKILKDNLIKEYLFGSYARDEQSDLSDIDILIIVKEFSAKLRREISTLSSNYSLDKGVLISPIIKDLDIWEKNKKYETLFYREVVNYGVEL